MPTATAVWLVDHTSLTFRQVANFCGLHPLEVQGIADETVAINMVGSDPTQNGQLTWDEIKRCQDDVVADLFLSVDEVPASPRTRGPRYTPVSKRQDKPSAIVWLVRNHPELNDPQIGKLIGTTKPTILAIRERTHWNISNIQAIDPVGLGLCGQIELDEAIRKALEKKEKKNPTPPKDAEVEEPAADSQEEGGKIEPTNYFK